MSEALATTTIPEALEQDARSVPQRAGALLVLGDEDYARAGALLRDVKTLRQAIEAHYRPLIDHAHKTHRALLDAAHGVDGPLRAAELQLKSRMAAYADERERKARLEAAERAAEARRRDEEARLAEAQALEAAGEKEAADAVLEAPPAPPPPAGQLAAPLPKVKGIAQRELWSAEVTDLKALLRGVLEGKVPMAALKVDQAWLNGQARALKSELAYPGVAVKRASSIAAASAS